MSQGNRSSHAFSFGPFVWWFGVVEDRKDPEKLGRLKVRIFGYHSPKLDKISTEDLFWAIPIQDITSAANSGIGMSPTGAIEGTTVFGFFSDGHAANTPIILGTIVGKLNKDSQIQGGGFVDPNGKYPTYDTDEAGTNRLSRAESIEKTIVQKKKDSLETAKIAFGGEWKELETAYAAEYPYNHVRETESGHILEFDDTEGSERIQLYHKEGSFIEIHPDSSSVTKVVKDSYSITIKDDYVLIKGNSKVNIQGDSSVLIEGNANIEVKGNCKHEIKGNYDLTVKGNFNTTVEGEHTLTAKKNQTSNTSGNEVRKAKNILLN